MEKQEQEQLKKIKNKLTELQKNGWEKYTYLSTEIEKHKFILEPHYQEEQVSSFENQFGITLPSQFRTFITTLGSFGAGPRYGLLYMDWYTETDLFEDPLKTSRSLQDPCVLEDKGYNDNWLEKIGGDDWEKRLYDDESWSPYQGMISIGNDGCTGRTALVINGPLRGRLFSINTDLWPPRIYPELSFFDWYEAWLDALIEEKENNHLGVYVRTKSTAASARTDCNGRTKTSS